MPNKARCKFSCESVQRFVNSEKVTLRAHYDPTLPEDLRFSKNTPSGTMEFILDNPNLHGFFVPGKIYFIDLEPCE